MSNTGTDPLHENEKLSKWFFRFSEQTAGSDMYQFLSKKISQDIELLDLASTADQTQPVPNLFLAAVNFLLYKNKNHELAKFYPNHSGHKFNESNVFEVFKSFCLGHCLQITDIMKTRLVQTNEVRRCALLLPAIMEVANETKNEIALIDVGTSTGLNLLLDAYSYSYSNGYCTGNSRSNLKISCEMRGNNFQNTNLPKISRRIGVDLNPINLKDEDEIFWTLSLVWPDQVERIQRLKDAIEILNKQLVELIKGDGTSVLESVTKNISVTTTICVMHSFTLNQFSAEARLSFDKSLANASQTHDVWQIGLEWIGTELPELYLNHYSSGNLKNKKKLATCHQHGEWINWL